MAILEWAAHGEQYRVTTFVLSVDDQEAALERSAVEALRSVKYEQAACPASSPCP